MERFEQQNGGAAARLVRRARGVALLILGGALSLVGQAASAANTVAPVAPTAPVAPPAPNAPAAFAAEGAEQNEGEQDLGGDGEPGASAAVGEGPDGSAQPVDLLPPVGSPAHAAAPPGSTAGHKADGTDPPSRVGRVSLVEGNVSVRAGATGASNVGVWLEAARNRPLVTGDSVWADRDSRAELHLGGVEVRLGAETLLQVLLLDDAHLRLALLQGTLDVRAVATDDQRGTAEILPPGLVVQIGAPGTYRFDVDKAGKLVGLRSQDGGRAEVQGEGESVTVAAGQILSDADATGRGLVVREGQPPRDNFDSWADERAAHLRQPASLRYVSRNMVGYEDLDGYGTWSSSPTYGPLWTPNQISAGWAPFRYGHWVNVPPWGWTWVDDAPWGFAPFHYGRWVNVRSHWYWAPGAFAVYPIYAPHMVAFGSGASLGFGAGYVGWYPLGFYDPFYPAYPCSYAYARGINGPRPAFPAAGGGPRWRPNPHGPRVPGRGPVLPGSVTVVPRQTIAGGFAVGSAHRPIVPQHGGALANGSWGPRMPVQPGAAFGPTAGAAHPPSGMPGSGHAPVGAAAPPGAAWARGGQAGRAGPAGRGGPSGGFNPRITHVDQPPRVEYGPHAFDARPGYHGGGQQNPAAFPRSYPAMPAYRFEPHFAPHGFAPAGGGGQFGGRGSGGMHFQGHVGGSGGVVRGGRR